jgi:hypothetical protein
VKIGRNLIQAFLLCAVLLILPALAQAQFTFTTNNGAITITGYTGSGGNIVIPSVINGCPVKNIGNFAFSPAPGNTIIITSVVMPDSVTNIGRNAFYDCGRLTNVVVSTNVTLLDNEVFGFTGLTSFTFPSGLTSIGIGAFDNCLSLTNVVIPSGVQYIGDYAFNDSYSMTSVTIPDSVTNLGDWAFSGCINITNLTIGNGITSIAPDAFTWCVNLTTVSIPDSVTNIETTYYDSAFSDCFALTNITYGAGLTANAVGNLRFRGDTNLCTLTVSTNNPTLSSLNGVLFDKGQGTLIQCPIGKAGSYRIPDSVTNVWQQAFWNCSALADMAINNSITTAGSGFFNGCTGLTNITIVDSVTYIQTFTFYQCVNLNTITVDPNNPFYSSSDGVVFDKYMTTIIKYPNNGAESLIISNGITSIAPGAFAYCTSLSNIALPKSLINLGYYAFFDCLGLTSITIPEGVTSIEDYLFYNCASLTNVTILGGVTNIGPFAFVDCYLLTRVVFEGDAPSADASAFLDMTGFSYSPATVYYLPGTTGWSNTLAYVPTSLWLPETQTSDTSFGVNTNGFGFNINWVSGQRVVVEACTNLSHPDWQPVATNTLTGSTAYFSDPQWTNYPGRFYRLRSP